MRNYEDIDVDSTCFDRFLILNKNTTTSLGLFQIILLSDLEYVRKALSLRVMCLEYEDEVHGCSAN